MAEEFRPIKGYENYYVSSSGRIINTKKGRFLTFTEDKDGYFKTTLFKNGKPYFFRVHRLVAQEFIPNPDNLDTVDHIDGNKKNNSVNNLQWLSRGENTKRFWKEQATEDYLNGFNVTFGRPKKTVFCFETNKIYESLTQASKELQIKYTDISKVLSGKQKSTHGLHFKEL